MTLWSGLISREVEKRLNLFCSVSTAEVIEITSGYRRGRERRETFSPIYISKKKKRNIYKRKYKTTLSLLLEGNYDG